MRRIRCGPLLICYRCFAVRLCVSSVNHDRELCKKWMSRSSAVWVVDLGMGSKNIIIGAGPPPLELERLKIILGNAHGRHTERGSSSAAAGYC